MKCRIFNAVIRKQQIYGLVVNTFSVDFAVNTLFVIFAERFGKLHYWQLCNIWKKVRLRKTKSYHNTVTNIPDIKWEKNQNYRTEKIFGHILTRLSGGNLIYIFI